MSTYKLMAIDMDGTMLNSNKLITLATKQTIDQALKQQKHIVLSTGRALSELSEYKNELNNLQYGICESGALIYDFKNQQAIHYEIFSKELINKILEVIDHKDIMLHFFSKGQSFIANGILPKMENYQMGQYQPLFKKVAKQIDNHLDYLKEHQVEKINLYHRDEASRQQTYELLKNLPLSLAFAEKTSLEISPISATKGKGLIKLCKYLDLDISKTIAIGDSDNDIDILKTAGLAIAMKNANDKVKNICNIIVNDNDHDGCKEAIETYLLNQK